MDLQDLAQLGVGGLFAYGIIKLVLDFLSSRKNFEREYITQKQFGDFLNSFADYYKIQKEFISEQTKAISSMNANDEIMFRRMELMWSDITDLKKKS